MSDHDRSPRWSTNTLRMLYFFWIGLILLFSNHVVADTECSDCCPEAGSAFNLTCTGLKDGNCDWFKESTTVMQCFQGAGCFPAAGSPGYTGYQLSDSKYVLQIDSLDKSTHDGQFKCNQAGDDYFFSLIVARQKPSDDLSGTCQDGTVECTLTNHGDPAVTLQLKDGSTVLSSSNTSGRVSHEGEDGKTYTCELNETSCVTNTRKDVMCQATTIPPTTSPVTTTTTTTVTTTTTTTSTATVTENNTAITTITTTGTTTTPLPIPIYGIVIIVVVVFIILLVAIICCARKCKCQNEKNREGEMCDVPNNTEPQGALYFNLTNQKTGSNNQDEGSCVSSKVNTNQMTVAVDPVEDNLHPGQRSEVGMQRL